MRPVPGDLSSWTIHDATGKPIGGASGSSGAPTSGTARSSHPTNPGGVAVDNGNWPPPAVTPTANETWMDCPHWVTGPCFTRPRAGDRSSAVIYDGEGRPIGAVSA